VMTIKTATNSQPIVSICVVRSALLVSCRSIKTSHAVTTPKRHAIKLTGLPQSRDYGSLRNLRALGVDLVIVPQRSLRVLQKEPSKTYSSAISKTLGLNDSVIETPHARHSYVCNSGNPPIFGIERTNRMAVPQLGQHGAGW
jgi:hypothetical protein